MFSNAVKIDNLNDYNKDSEECIKPFLFEVEAVGPPKLEKPNLIHVRKKDKTTKHTKARGEISLTDCLACSGCVTNEETTFLQSQNAIEILNNIKNKKINIISLSLQSVVALSALFNLPLHVTQKKLCFLFKSLNFDYVFDSSISELITLHAAKKEFVDFFSKNGEKGSEKGNTDKRTSGQKEKKKKFPIIFKKKKKGKIVDDYYMCEEEEEKKHETENEGALNRLHQLPLLCSHCSGVVIYGEKHFDDEFLNSFSKLKSNQEIQGIIVKLTLLHKGLSVLNSLKKNNANNFFKFCESQWNFLKICEKHFSRNCNLLRNATEGKTKFSLNIFDINHVYLLYCFDKKIEAHKYNEEQQKVIEENVNFFLEGSSFLRRQQGFERQNMSKTNDKRNIEKKKGKEDKDHTKKEREKNNKKNNKEQLHLVDAVLTTVELVELMKNMDINFYALPELEIDNVYHFLSEYKRRIEEDEDRQRVTPKENNDETYNGGTINSIEIFKDLSKKTNGQTDNANNNNSNNDDYFGTLLKENEIELKDVFTKISNYSIRIGNKNNISMGYGEEIFKEVCKNVFHFPVNDKNFNFQYLDIVVLSLFKDDICVFRVVLSYGLKSMYKVINKIKQDREIAKQKSIHLEKCENVKKNDVKQTEPTMYQIKVTYDLHFYGRIDYVELMACEKGCLLGCAQNVFHEDIKKDNTIDCSCHNMYIFRMIHEKKIIDNWNFLYEDKFLEKEKMDIFCSSEKCIYKKIPLNKQIILDTLKGEEEQGTGEKKQNFQPLKKKINIQNLFEKLNRIMHDDKYTLYVSSNSSVNDSVVSTFLKRIFLMFNKNNFHIFKGVISSRKQSDILNW